MKIKLAVVASAAISLSFPSFAGAQDAQALRDASVSLYQVCIVASGDAATNAGCACTAGFIGGALTEREYEVVARIGEIGVMSESGASEEEIQAAVDLFFADGYTLEEADAANAKLAIAAAKGDAICAPYGEEPSS